MFTSSLILVPPENITPAATSSGLRHDFLPVSVQHNILNPISVAHTNEEELISQTLETFLLRNRDTFSWQLTLWNIIQKDHWINEHVILYKFHHSNWKKLI